MEICRCCYNCSNAILGDDATWDCPPTFYGCMLNKDISIHKNGWGKNLDCFAYEEETKESKKQKQIKRAEMFKERTRQRELAELARLKAKYEL